MTQCNRHPKYKVKREPTSTCRVCWYIWTQKATRKLVTSIVCKEIARDNRDRIENRGGLLL